MGTQYLHDARLRDVVFTVGLIVIVSIPALLPAVAIRATLPFQAVLRFEELQLPGARLAL